MFVPIIMDPCAFYDYRYLWEYLKYQYHCYENKWPLIAESCYKIYKEKRPISNVYEKEFCDLHQYRVLTEEEEGEVNKYFINENIFDDLERKCGSKLGMKIYLLKNRYKPLEKELKRIVKQIKKDIGESIEGFMCWNSCYFSVRHVAGKMKIPIITNEFSLRFPEYYPMGYFCKKDIYEQDEITDLYRQFEKDKHKISFEYLSRKEMLALLLENMDFDVEQLYSEHKNFEIGIAGCHPIIPTFFSKSTYTDLELIQDVRRLYSEEDILFRKHPGDEPYQANYTLLNRDDSLYASGFIRKCKRITAIGSNILLEGLLFGKKVYSKNISPFTIFCERELKNKEPEIVDDDIMNFILFGYLIPYNKMFDEKYIKWRLKEKDIITIIETNIRYYFSEMRIPREVLYLSRKERYDIICGRRKK